MILNLDKIKEFTIEAHKGVYRKCSGKPYSVHPIAVCEMVKKLGMNRDYDIDYEMQAAALLHDVVEDTKFTLQDIEKISNNRVASIVDELTLVYNTPEEKVAELEKFRDKSPEALFIKVVDRICNTLDFVNCNEDYALDYWDKSLVIMSIYEDNYDCFLEYFGSNATYAIEKLYDNTMFLIYYYQSNSYVNKKIQECLIQLEDNSKHIHRTFQKIFGDINI